VGLLVRGQFMDTLPQRHTSPSARQRIARRNQRIALHHLQLHAFQCRAAENTPAISLAPVQYRQQVDAVRERARCVTRMDRRQLLTRRRVSGPGIARPGQSQLACWQGQPESSGFPKFNALIFSADTILPALDTGQRAYWSPDTRDPFGRKVKQFTYFSTIAGWALSLLAVAGFTGLVRSG